MRRPSSALLGLSLSMVLPLVGCLSQPTATAGDAGTDAPAVAEKDSGAAGCDPTAAPAAATIAAATNDEDAVSPYITYMDDLTTHPGCTTVGLTYTPAVINGGAYTCAAKDYGAPAVDDPTKPIIVLVHGNSSAPTDWETYTSGGQSDGPMISETLVADGYHVYASDVRFDKVPVDKTNNPAQNYDHGWAVPIVESLLTNLFVQYPAPRMFNIAGFSIGPTVIRDALRRMFRKGLNPFARIHALHYASGGNHGVSTYETYCGSEQSPINPTMAGLAACQLGNRTNYVITPFEQPLNGGQADIASFDTPCSDGSTAYGISNACGCNKVVYTTVVFADETDGTLLDEFVSEKSSALVGATNLTVTEPEPGICPPSTSNCQEGYFFYPNFEYHYGSIRSADGIMIAKTALETN
jgi:hypothetical protein